MWRISVVRIQEFPPGSTSATNGTMVAGGGTAGNLIAPVAVFGDGAGNIYVADLNNNRIQEYPTGSIADSTGITVAGGNGAGSASNQLSAPDGLYVDGAGNIYVSDHNNSRIQKFPAGSTSATNAVTVAGGNGQAAPLIS